MSKKCARKPEKTYTKIEKNVHGNPKKQAKKIRKPKTFFTYFIFDYSLQVLYLCSKRKKIKKPLYSFISINIT